MPVIAMAQVLDHDFDPDVDGIILGVVVQADGKVIVAGDFTTIDGKVRNRVARLNADGSLDNGFADLSIDNVVRTVQVQPDGRILIGGNFNVVGPYTRHHLARLNSDGTVDADFNPDADGSIYAIACQSDGKIIVGGKFHHIGGTERNYLARLNADGSLDTAYSVHPDNPVLALTMQQDGKLLVGGRFTSITVRGYQWSITTPAARLARVGATDSTTGHVDDTFLPVVDSDVKAILELPNHGIVIGGAFTHVNSIPRAGLARLTVDGDVDAFDPQPDGDVNALVLQSDGKIVLGGVFTQLGMEVRDHLARLEATGAVDVGFGNTFVDDDVYAIAVQDDGRILTVGRFTSAGMVPRNYIARFEETPAGVVMIQGANLGAIPDAQPGAPTCGAGNAGPSRDIYFEVPDLQGMSVVDLEVSLTFDPAHTWGGDITARLIDPSGTRVHTLFGRLGATSANGCGRGADLAGPYTFTDLAYKYPAIFWQVAASNSAVPAGDYFPSNSGGEGAEDPMPPTSLAATYAGMSSTQAQGTWVLRVVDSGDGDVGTVSDATLTLYAEAFDSIFDDGFE